MPKTPEQVEQIAYDLIKQYGDDFIYMDYDTTSSVNKYGEVKKPKYINPLIFKARIKFDPSEEQLAPLGPVETKVDAMLFTDTKHLSDVGKDSKDAAIAQQMLKGQIQYRGITYDIVVVKIGGQMGAYWMLTYIGLKRSTRRG